MAAEEIKKKKKSLFAFKVWSQRQWEQKPTTS